jgi:hypothetical protein
MQKPSRVLSGRLTEKSSQRQRTVYDTRLGHDELCRKKISALIPPRKGAGYLIENVATVPLDQNKSALRLFSTLICFRLVRKNRVLSV